MNAVATQHNDKGYIDGLEQGKSETIQSGFNEGFVHGGRIGFEFGQLKGAAQSLRILSNHAAGSSVWATAVEKSDKYLSSTSTVKAVKAAHIEFQGEGDGEFKNALESARIEVESVGIVLQDYPGGKSATA